jgi:hypothetical protein
MRFLKKQGTTNPKEKYTAPSDRKRLRSENKRVISMLLEMTLKRSDD